MGGGIAPRPHPLVPRDLPQNCWGRLIRRGGGITPGAERPPPRPSPANCAGEGDGILHLGRLPAAPARTLTPRPPLPYTTSRARSGACPVRERGRTSSCGTACLPRRTPHIKNPSPEVGGGVDRRCEERAKRRSGERAARRRRARAPLRPRHPPVPDPSAQADITSSLPRFQSPGRWLGPGAITPSPTISPPALPHFRTSALPHFRTPVHTPSPPTFRYPDANTIATSTIRITPYAAAPPKSKPRS